MAHISQVIGFGLIYSVFDISLLKNVRGERVNSGHQEGQGMGLP
jgi:hypothetical protein